MNKLNLYNSIEFKNFLAATIVIVWLIIILLCVLKQCNINDTLINNFNIIISYIIGYYFGSSQGSSVKNDILRNTTANNNRIIKNKKTTEIDE